MDKNKDESTMNVQINMNICFICGKNFEGDKEKHHAIPRCNNAMVQLASVQEEVENLKKGA